MQPIGKPGWATARTVALIYLLFGVLWIILTDWLLMASELPLERLMYVQIGKGWAFVSASALLVYLLVRYCDKQCKVGMESQIEAREDTERRNAELESKLEESASQVRSANRDFEALAASISNHLRAPLRHVLWLSQSLLTSATGVDDRSQQDLQRIRETNASMARFVDELLQLASATKTNLAAQEVNLSELCEESAAALRVQHPDEEIAVSIAPDMRVRGDAQLLRVAIDNLLHNAWRCTPPQTPTQIEIGVEHASNEAVYFVRKNGSGRAGESRSAVEAPAAGSAAPMAADGIALKTVQRIISRHGGRVWAEPAPDRGDAFYFTVQDEARSSERH